MQINKVFSSLDTMKMHAPTWIREVTDKVTNVVMNYSDTEAKVREATNDEPWGPSGTLMQELAHSTYVYEQFPEVMGMLWCRLFSEGSKNWRKIYKCFVLLSYLLHYGSEHVVNNARNRIRKLQTFEVYTCMDAHGKDEGLNVRKKAEDVIVLLKDTERLREERRRAKASRDKYVGYSSEEARRSSFFRGKYPVRENVESLSTDDSKDDKKRRKSSDFESRNGSSHEYTFEAGGSAATLGLTSVTEENENTSSKKHNFSSNTRKVDLGAAKDFTGTRSDSAGVSAKSVSESTPQSANQQSQFDGFFGAPFTDFQSNANPQGISQQPQFGFFQSSDVTTTEDEFDLFAASSARRSIPNQPPNPQTSPISPAPFNSPMAPQDVGNCLFTSSTMQSSPMQPCPSPNILETNPYFSANPFINPEQQPQICNNTASPSISPANTQNTDTSQKPNTWSSIDGVDISLDSLKQHRRGVSLARKPDSVPMNNNVNLNKEQTAYPPQMMAPPFMNQQYFTATMANGTGGAYFAYPMAVVPPATSPVPTNPVQYQVGPGNFVLNQQQPQYQPGFR